MKPGTRVTVQNRAGVVKALRPGNSVDVQFDGESFITRHGSSHVKPIRENPGPRGGLTTAERESLPTSVFALPGRRFPINDANHGRIALQYILAGRVAERDVNTVVQAVLQRWGRNREVMAFYNKHKAKLTRQNVERIHGRRMAANPAGEVYDPAKEQLRAQAQGIYETAVRKKLSVHYKTPFVDDKGVRLDSHLSEEERRDLFHGNKKKRIYGAMQIAVGLQQKHGYLIPGTLEPTAKGIQRSEERLLDPAQRKHAEANRQDYERTLAGVRKSRYYRVVTEVIDGQKRHIVQPRPPAGLVQIPAYRMSAEKAEEDANLAEAAFLKAPQSVKARANPYYLTSPGTRNLDIEDEPAHIILKPRDSLLSAARRLGVSTTTLQRYGIMESPDGAGGWEEMVPGTLPRSLGIAPGNESTMPDKTLFPEQYAGYRIRKDLLIQKMESSPEMQGHGKYALFSERESARSAFRAAEKVAESARSAQTEALIAAHEAADISYAPGRSKKALKRHVEETIANEIGRIDRLREEADRDEKSYSSDAITETEKPSTSRIVGLRSELLRALSAWDAGQHEVAAGQKEKIERARATERRLQEALDKRDKKYNPWLRLPPDMQLLRKSLQIGSVFLFRMPGTVPRLQFIGSAETDKQALKAGTWAADLLAGQSRLQGDGEQFVGYRSKAFRVLPNAAQADAVLALLETSARDKGSQAEADAYVKLRAAVEKSENLEREKRKTQVAPPREAQGFGLPLQGMSPLDRAREMVSAGQQLTGGLQFSAPATIEAYRQREIQKLLPGGGKTTLADVAAAYTTVAARTDLPTNAVSAVASMLSASSSDILKLATAQSFSIQPAVQAKGSMEVRLGLTKKKTKPLVGKVERKEKDERRLAEKITVPAFFGVEFRYNIEKDEVEPRYTLYLRKKMASYSKIERLGGIVQFTDQRLSARGRNKLKRGPDTPSNSPEAYQMQFRETAEAESDLAEAKRSNDSAAMGEAIHRLRRARRNETRLKNATLVGQDRYQRGEFVSLDASEKLKLFNLTPAKEVAGSSSAPVSRAAELLSGFDPAFLKSLPTFLTPDKAWLQDKSFSPEMRRMRTFDPVARRMFTDDQRGQFQKFYTTSALLAYYTIHLWNTPELFTGTAILLPDEEQQQKGRGAELEALVAGPVTEDNVDRDPYKVYKELLGGEIELRAGLYAAALRNDWEEAARYFICLFGLASFKDAKGNISPEQAGVHKVLEKLGNARQVIPSEREIFGVWSYQRVASDLKKAAAEAIQAARFEFETGQIDQDDFRARLEEISFEEKTVVENVPPDAYSKTQLGAMFEKNLLRGESVPETFLDSARYAEQIVSEAERSTRKIAADLKTALLPTKANPGRRR
jgi:hypothetical protein